MPRSEYECRKWTKGLRSLLMTNYSMRSRWTGVSCSVHSCKTHKEVVISPSHLASFSHGSPLFQILLTDREHWKRSLLKTHFRR